MKILLLILITFNLMAQTDLTVVAVGEAELEKDTIVFRSNATDFLKSPEHKHMNEVTKLFSNNFSFYKEKFDVKKDEVKNEKVRFIVSLKYSLTPLRVSIEVVDSISSSKVFESSTVLFGEKMREQAHRVADELFRQIVGKPSMFNSKIVFVSDRNSSKGNIVKELYMMDFDGKNVSQLTSHRGTVISPAVSHDGKLVLYSLIKEGRRKRNVDLYLYNLETKNTELLSSKNGINSGAIFSPDGKSIYLTLSHEGNAEIYQMQLNDKSLRKITSHYSPDVDPSVNVTGDIMTFLSGRSGKPMIYTLDPRDKEKDVKRISFVGQFNATPRFSPDGKEIAFSSWLDNRFDIFRINSDGSGLYRLTKDFGSNEDPTYSSDGQFIAFSSQRVISRTKAVQNIYIMSRDGEILGPLTENSGNCITPRWTKSL